MRPIIAVRRDAETRAHWASPLCWSQGGGVPTLLVFNDHTEQVMSWKNDNLLVEPLCHRLSFSSLLFPFDLCADHWHWSLEIVSLLTPLYSDRDKDIFHWKLIKESADMFITPPTNYSCNVCLWLREMRCSSRFPCLWCNHSLLWSTLSEMGQIPE